MGTCAKKLTVSVVIPTHNRAIEVGRALRSVLNQRRAADEIIVVDDGSTDGTCARIEAEFPRVKLLSQRHSGVSRARNLGIEKSTGDWLAFLDSDDEWLPEKLERQIETVAAQPDSPVCHCDEIWIRKGIRVNPMKKHQKRGGWIFTHCLPLCRISPSAVLLHRSVFERVGTFDESLPVCEDYDLWLRVTSRYPVLYIDHPLIIKYGGHADQLSQRYWGMDRFRIRALEKILTEGHLRPHEHRAAREMLVKKARIFINGARKRNRIADALKYEALCARYDR